MDQNNSSNPNQFFLQGEHTQEKINQNRQYFRILGQNVQKQNLNESKGKGTLQSNDRENVKRLPSPSQTSELGPNKGNNVKCFTGNGNSKQQTEQPKNGKMTKGDQNKNTEDFLIIGPFHYNHVTLELLSKELPKNVLMDNVVVFYVPYEELCVGNEKVVNRWLWCSETDEYSILSDVVPILIHSSRYIPNRNESEKHFGILSYFKYLDKSVTKYPMKRKNGIRSRFSSKPKDQLVEIISTQILDNAQMFPERIFKSVNSWVTFNKENCHPLIKENHQKIIKIQQELNKKLEKKKKKNFVRIPITRAKSRSLQLQKERNCKLKNSEITQNQIIEKSGDLNDPLIHSNPPLALNTRKTSNGNITPLIYSHHEISSTTLSKDTISEYKCLKGENAQFERKRDFVRSDQLKQMYKNESSNYNLGSLKKKRLNLEEKEQSTEINYQGNLQKKNSFTKNHNPKTIIKKEKEKEIKKQAFDHQTFCLFQKKQDTKNNLSKTISTEKTTFTDLEMYGFFFVFFFFFF
ncbi:hypothetical protein M0813_13185 [Anaeramoeba flamelloides]|uniref:Uncharacterized protein n=1 Tax=Anaeramoeba flamelloides TaxID=1746091 RepID=A0ABQ8ZAF8_9EUKA|nr:hypothetical protein M0813_13185 [Anaeramoeba flamelloides]